MLVSLLCPTLRLHRLQPTRLLCPWDSPGKNTGVDCHSLLQRTFLTQGLNPGLLHCRLILYCLGYREVPEFKYPMDYTVHRILQARILEWVACSFSSRSFRPRNWTGVSCIARGFFTSWATRKAQLKKKTKQNWDCIQVSLKSLA